MQVGSQHWTVASLATGAAALVSLLLAFATTHWLYMKEKCKEPYLDFMNNTAYANLTMYTNVGILQICTWSHAGSEDAEAQVYCVESGISKGLDKNSERDDTQWKTGTVIEAIRIQFPLTCLAVILTLCGFVCSIIGNFRRDKRIIIAAVLYISSGLCLSISVILFISRINDELSLQVSHKCSSFQYSYGWSFYLIGLSFVMEETSAVISVKLFLMKTSNKLNDMIKLIPGLEEKFQCDLNGTNSCKSLKSNCVEMDHPMNQTLIW